MDTDVGVDSGTTAASGHLGLAEIAERIAAREGSHRESFGVKAAGTGKPIDRTST